MKRQRKHHGTMVQEREKGLEKRLGSHHETIRGFEGPLEARMHSKEIL